jgi:hypothetical protein
VQQFSWPAIVIAAIFVVGGILVIRLRATVARCIPEFSLERGVTVRSRTSASRIIAARVLGVVLILAGALVGVSAFVRL